MKLNVNVDVDAFDLEFRDEVTVIVLVDMCRGLIDQIESLLDEESLKQYQVEDLNDSRTYLIAAMHTLTYFTTEERRLSEFADIFGEDDDAASS